MKSKFLSDVKELRERARQHIENGAVTSNRDNVDTILKLLDTALATELVCVLRYRRHYFCAKGLYSESVAAEFLEHANEELSHADMLAERIGQLGGEPNFHPDNLSSRSHSEYVEGDDLVEMIKENLVAERIAIESYREMIDFIGASDPTTRRMLEEILSVEEEHADDMLKLLEPRLKQ